MQRKGNMSDIKEQVLSFFEKCDELKKCKFIMATTKISDILKCIVTCPELYNVFNAVTRDFNYPLTKSQCLITVNDGMFTRSYLVMPQTVGQRLAFVFCLLVEFDKGTLNLNDFLRKYFPEDGSYFASYHAFCDTVIKGMEDAIAQVFREELAKPMPVAQQQTAQANPAKAGLISAIELAISEEKQYILSCNLIPETEKEGGLAMLTQLFEAVKSGNEQLINAIICGYNYFVLYYKCVSDGVAALINDIAAYEQIL